MSPHGDLSLSLSLSDTQLVCPLLQYWMAFSDRGPEFCLHDTADLPVRSFGWWSGPRKENNTNSNIYTHAVEDPSSSCWRSRESESSMRVEGKLLCADVIVKKIKKNKHFSPIKRLHLALKSNRGYSVPNLVFSPRRMQPHWKSANFTILKLISRKVYKRYQTCHGLWAEHLTLRLLQTCTGSVYAILWFSPNIFCTSLTSVQYRWLRKQSFISLDLFSLARTTFIR